MAPPVTPPATRLWPKLDVGHPLGCWTWTGTTTAAGYGQITERDGPRSRRLYTHRVSYEALVSPIPDGLVIDHLCRNTLCANPDHLEPVTRGENLRRGIGADLSRRRASAPHGTYARYSRRSDPCRCGPCVEAARTYKREWQRKKDAA